MQEVTLLPANGSKWKFIIGVFGILLPIGAAVMTPVYLTMASAKDDLVEIRKSVTEMSIGFGILGEKIDSVDTLYKSEIENLKARLEHIEEDVRRSNE